MTGREPARRSWLDVRMRQVRNPPPPVLRAVLANVAVAAVGGTLLVIYGLVNPAADLAPLVVVFVVVVMVAGSVLTYLWVRLPSGSSGARQRSGWAAVLGFFASVPIAYLVLVVALQVILPALS